jgi:hypothetical protein
VPIPEVESIDQLPTGMGVEHQGHMVNVAGIAHMWNGVSWLDVAGRTIPGRQLGQVWDGEKWLDDTMTAAADMVNKPPHYTRGPFIQLGDNPATTGRDTMEWIRPTVEYGRRVGIVLECLDVIRHIKDGRLFTASKYIWRVAFGGKPQPGMTQDEADRQDIEKAIVYLRDWLEHRV